MPSFTTSLKDTLSELTTSSKSKPEDKICTSQDNDKNNWTQASSQAARAYDDYRQGHSSQAREELEQAASAAASAYQAGGGKFDAQEFAGGLVSGLIPGAKSGSGDGSGSGFGGGGLLPVNLKGEGPEGEGGEEKVKSGGGGGVERVRQSDSGGVHEEGVTTVNDPVKEKSGCACFTGTDARTGTKPPTCCATTGSCADCKGCKEDSQDKGAYCQCQCQNQKSKNTGGEGCACQRQDDAGNTHQQDNGQKSSSSFKDISTASGLGAGAGAGTGEDYTSNNPLASDAINTGQSTVHDFGGTRASGLDIGRGDFDLSPSAITAATDELIAGAKNDSESAGGRGTGAYTSGALGGEFGGQD